jgi:hypothetical protein
MLGVDNMKKYLGTKPAVSEKSIKRLEDVAKKIKLS